MVKLKIVLEKGEDGYYVVSVPALRGCHTQGKTKKEALEHIREAIALYLDPFPISHLRPSQKRQVLTLAL